MCVNIAEKARNIEGQIAALMGRLSQLAPHPDRPHYKGPLFIRSVSGIKSSAEYEGMLGSMVLESVLGAAFSEVANDCLSHSGLEDFGTQDMDLGSFLDAADEYFSDRDDLRGHGKGTFAIGEHKVLSPLFNKDKKAAMMEAFLAQLPERMFVEGKIAQEEKELLRLRASFEGPSVLAA